MKGNLILCQHGDRRLAILKDMESDVPEFETVVDNFEGKTFNSPNDIVEINLYLVKGLYILTIH